MSAASTSGLSASVTRILSLTGFAKELKTKDIQTAFSDWESIGGGFKIKWRDDTSLLIVFQDASIGTPSYTAFPSTFHLATYSQTCLSSCPRIPSYHSGIQSGGFYQTI